MNKIEKGIPMKSARRGAPRKYPWLEMDVEDSFLVEGKSAHYIRELAYHAAKRYGMKFAVRTVEDGVRVWRVE